jgi:hypothetical protein
VVRLSGALHVASIQARRAGLARMRRQLDDGARLGAFLAYLPCPDVAGPEAWAYFVEGCHLLADHAAGLCLGVSLPLGAAAWPDELYHGSVAYVAEGDDDELVKQCSPGLLPYVRRPGKLLKDTLAAREYDSFVAVDLHSPHTSSSTSSAT